MTNEIRLVLSAPDKTMAGEITPGFHVLLMVLILLWFCKHRKPKCPNSCTYFYTSRRVLRLKLAQLATFSHITASEHFTQKFIHVIQTSLSTTIFWHRIDWITIRLFCFFIFFYVAFDTFNTIRMYMLTRHNEWCANFDTDSNTPGEFSRAYKSIDWPVTSTWWPW